jgi:hypothetical protein
MPQNELAAVPLASAGIVLALISGRILSWNMPPNFHSKLAIGHPGCGFNDKDAFFHPRSRGDANSPLASPVPSNGNEFAQ